MCLISTILHISGLRVTIYPNHPRHLLHVVGPNGEAAFLLNRPAGPADLDESFGFSRPELRRVMADLLVHIRRLRAERGTPWKSLMP